MRFLSHEPLYSRTEECLEFLRRIPDRPSTRGQAGRERYHMYWHGTLTRKLAFAVKSFLATQDLGPSEL